MKRHFLKGQSVAEYFILISVILAAILACGFVDNIRGIFLQYFGNATTAMTNVTNP